jgi:hypothetical protein
MTSSTSPRSAAMYAFAKRSVNSSISSARRTSASGPVMNMCEVPFTMKREVGHRRRGHGARRRADP